MLMRQTMWHKPNLETSESPPLRIDESKNNDNNNESPANLISKVLLDNFFKVFIEFNGSNG